MEFLFVIVLWFVGVWLFGVIVGAVKGTAKAAGRAVIGKGTLKENMELEFKGMGSMRVRVVEGERKEDTPFFLEIECRGLFPVYSSTNVGFMISVLSKNSEGELTPVLSMVDAFQESKSTAFQDLTGVGEISAGQGWIDWVRVGVVPPEILQPSISGRQDISIVVRLVDMDNLPEIYLGFGEGQLWMNMLEYSHNFKEKGYTEEAQHRDEARALSVRIGMAVAMADGGLDDSEGEALKNWIQRMVAPFSDEKQKELKKVYNDSLRESYQLAESGELVLSDICTKINEIGEEAQKYEALELAHEVMAADGVVHEEEMKIIHKVAKALNIDPDELEKIRDQQIVTLDTKTSNLDVEGLLGIDTSLSNEEIKAHLRKEFQKWNNRLNTLSEGEERDNAQQMLDLIAKARKKYA